MLLSYISDYVERSRETLPSQFWNKLRIDALVSGLSCGAQMLEDLMYDINLSFILTNASGDQLNKWGSLVKEDRLGLSDARYRTIIQAKVAAKKSGSTVADVLGVWIALMRPLAYNYMLLPPAAFCLDAQVEEPLSAQEAARVKRIMGYAAGGGIGLCLIQGPSNFFIFDDASRGFDQAPLSGVI